MNFWDFFWLLIWSYFVFAYLMLIFQVFGDLFRDPELGGWSKALWTLGLVVFPFLGVLAYLISRGQGMAGRQLGAIKQARAQTDEYIQSVAGRSNSAEQIASAKALLDNGTITQNDFERLKEKALV
jgi:hypothetical protein